MSHYDTWHESYLKILRAAYILNYNAEATCGVVALLSFPSTQSMLHASVQPCQEAQSKALEQRISGMSALNGLRFRTRRPIASYCRDDEVMACTSPLVQHHCAFSHSEPNDLACVGESVRSGCMRDAL